MPLIPVAALAAHGWCGSVEPGKGLLLERLGKKDRMCGFIQAKYDGAHRFTANVPGVRLWIGRELVDGPITLKADSFYAILIEAPKSEDFRLSWDQPLGVALEIPPVALYQPTETVVKGCVMPDEVKR
ncbi:MAG: hypothetical protein ABI645_01735 [Pseudomonadota bacterium]